MERRGFRLFRLGGIEVDVDPSWLLVFALVVWGVSGGYLPRRYPGQSPASYLGAGTATALLAFASVLVHEYCHCLAARSVGIRVRRITLFLFGGVSHMPDEAPTPAAELRIALAGPLSSLALSAAFGAATLAWGRPGSLLAAVLGYLAAINLTLAIFNLVPGFPLDGGRVLRALVWWRTGSLTRATQVAAAAGKGFSVLLMVLGGLQILAGSLVGGLWLILIGLFLRNMAEGGYRDTLLRRALEGVRVRDVMVEDPITVAPELSVDGLVREYILHRGHKGFPVVQGDQVLGLVGLMQARSVREEDRASTRVSDVMIPVEDDLCISPDAPLSLALQAMDRTGADRLLVLRAGRLLGLITRSGVLRFVELRRLLTS